MYQIDARIHTIYKCITTSEFQFSRCQIIYNITIAQKTNTISMIPMIWTYLELFPQLSDSLCWSVSGWAWRLVLLQLQTTSLFVFIFFTSVSPSSRRDINGAITDVRRLLFTLSFSAPCVSSFVASSVFALLASGNATVLFLSLFFFGLRGEPFNLNGP